MDLKPTITGLQKLIKVLKSIQSPKKLLDDYQLVDGLQKALAALKEVGFERLDRFLSEEKKTMTDRIDKELSNGVKICSTLLAL